LIGQKEYNFKNMTPRPYQHEAIQAATMHFWRRCERPAVCVLPTGAGKSLVIAHIVEQVGGDFLILQPTKEILEQNIAKYRALGKEASIYSAILGEKIKSQVTFATIGSVFNSLSIFKTVKNVIIDECHYVNPKGGQYDVFLSQIPGLVCVGLTATPYRLQGLGKYAVIEFITRTLPAFFKEVIHVTQQSELLEAGFLSPIEYQLRAEINTDNVKLKASGTEYDPATLAAEYKRIKVEDLVIEQIAQNQGAKGVLVFADYVDTLDKIKAAHPDAQIITGSTDPTQRGEILTAFKAGQIKTVLNVGVLTTGFDYPELDCIIVAKAMRSLSLWYQIVGRGQRIAPWAGKEKCTVVDLCGNFKRLGDVQKLIVKKEQHTGRWIATNGRICTNKAF
jgi:DNA repair protein RadD